MSADDDSIARLRAAMHRYQQLAKQLSTERARVHCGGVAAGLEMAIDVLTYPEDKT